MPLLVIIRHGQSQWNLENKFTGITDVPLTERGREEARSAGIKLKGIHFSACFTSLLSRAQETLQIILNETGNTHLPVEKNKALNERDYGGLQGLDKTHTAEKYSAEQVQVWRRSYDIAPPGGESLKDTAARVMPYYNEHIKPILEKGENVLIVAHGNSLRALMMNLDNISPDKIADVEIPTGMPREYIMDEKLNIISIKYL